MWGGGYFCMGSPPGPTPLCALWRAADPLLPRALTFKSVLACRSYVPCLEFEHYYYYYYYYLLLATYYTPLSGHLGAQLHSASIPITRGALARKWASIRPAGVG